MASHIHTNIAFYICILYRQITQFSRIAHFRHERKGIPFHLRHCGPEKCDLYAHFPQNDDSAKMLILNTISDNLQKLNAFHEKIAQSVMHSIPEWIGTVFMGSKHRNHHKCVYKSTNYTFLNTCSVSFSVSSIINTYTNRLFLDFMHLFYV